MREPTADDVRLMAQFRENTSLLHGTQSAEYRIASTMYETMKAKWFRGMGIDPNTGLELRDYTT